MLKFRICLIIIFSSSIFADSLLSSPKLLLNTNGERVIEFKIQSTEISDEDIILKEYKSDELLPRENILYTLLEGFSNYKSFSIVIKNEYESNYFSFKIVLQEDLAKDIFIFLPSRIKTTSNDFTQPKPVEQKNTINVNSISKIEKVKEPTLKLAQQNIIQAEEITTMWSIASKIKKETNNTSIYQIMWSIYLGNKGAFIDGNINLVRKDKNLVIPSYATMGNVSSDEAKSSILAMNKSNSLDIAPAVKSLLVLTAPSIEKKQKPPELGIVEDKQEPSSININNENASNPEDFIKENTKQLEVVIENKIAKDLSNEINSIDESVTENNFGLMDLLFVAITSVLSGILIALIYIQLISRKTKNIQYDFEEAQDSKSSIQGLPKGLSIKNNHEEQQLDLAVTYFEMGNTEDCLSILNDLIKQSQDEEIKTSAQNLIEKIVKK